MTDFRLRCAQLLIEIQHESALTRKVHAELVAGQPPAVGEVPEMVEWLRCYCANECYGIEDDPNALQLTRAAELLEAFASGVWTVPDGKEPPLAIAEPSEEVETWTTTNWPDWKDDGRRVEVELEDGHIATQAAQPEPQLPADDDLLSLDDLRDAWDSQADAVNDWDELGIDEIVWWAQRQALARWGTAQPPADGEATEQPPLGPAAQAVLDATSGTFGNYQFTARGQMIAAALRAAAAQMYYAGAVEAGDWLVAIAAKLDGGAQ